MKRTLLMAALALAFIPPLAAQVSFTGSYSQNFDSLGTGTNLASLTGWSHLGALGGSNTTWTNSTGIPASGTTSAATAGTANNTLVVNSNAASATATSNTQGYNFALSGSTNDRCIGSSPTSGAGNVFQLRLTNNTGIELNGVRISYNIRRFTAPSTANELPGYWLFYSTNNGSTWTSVSSLNPALSDATVNVPNTAGVTSVALTSITFATSLANGSEVRFRWVDDNATETSPDQIIGLDNVVVQALQPPPTVSLSAPTEGQNYELPTVIPLTATAADSNGTVTKVEFLANGVKIGETTSEPYQFEWSGMISGSYSLTARAIDNDGDSTTSTAVSITVTNPDNQEPSVAITQPAEGSLIPADTFTLAAAASDTDGIISKVEFFDGATKLGESTSAPHTFTWTNIRVGSHVLTAKATDNDGATTTSAPVTVQAVAFTDTAQITRGAVWKYLDNGTDQGTAWKEPAFDDSAWQSGPAKLGYQDNAVTILREGPDGMTSATKFITYYFRRSFTLPTGAQALGLSVNLLRDDGAVIYVNGVEAARSNMPAGPVNYLTQSATTVSGADETTYYPITLDPALLLPGENVIAVSLHQRDNASSDLGFDMDLTVRTAGGNALPLVGITSPQPGATYFTGADITITAEAEDQDDDGSIAKVEFYANSTKIGEDTTAPYEFTWTDVTAGTKALTAVAIDNLGGRSTSAPVSVTVNSGPSGTLSRGPYLNSPSDTQIVVRWRSSNSVVGRVRYGTSPTALTQFVDESSARTDHEVKLTGLTPYTRYYYSVGSNAGDKLTPQSTETTSFSPGAAAPTAADYTFRTNPTPGDAVPTRVWVVGDCGRGTQVQANGRDAYYTWMGSRLPDLNIQLGDNAYNSGTDTEYQTRYWDMYHNIFRKMPQWSTLGNHDANNGSTSPTANFPYFDMFSFPTQGECGGLASGTERYYSFDYGNIHFVCLDSQSTLASSSATAPQTVWLKNDLAANTRTWTIVFFHHPPYSKGSHNSDSESQMVTMRQYYAPILEQYGVDIVFTGHSHNYERSYLLNGHYGIASTITSAMRVDAGNGSVNGFTASGSGIIREAPNFTTAATTNGTLIPGNGAYVKPLVGPRGNKGTVYNVAGMSGLVDSGSINHNAMYIGYNQVGTVNMEVDGNTLTCTFIQSGGATPDNFTIIKQGSELKPDAVTLAATSIGTTSATLRARVNPNAMATTALFQSGLTTGYGTDNSVSLSPTDGIEDQEVSITLSGLTPGTTYNYRISAANSNGGTDGVNMSFTTVSTDARLSGIASSDGAVSPEFNPVVSSYTIRVGSAVEQIILSPTTSHPSASVTVDGSSPTTPVSLITGDNLITLVVTAQDGVTQRTYNVTVRRLNDNAALAGLSIPFGTYSPAFNPELTEYTTTVGSMLEEIIITPILADENASVTVNGSSPTDAVPLTVGMNLIPVVVTAEDGTTQRSYTLTIKRLSFDTSLAGLSLSDGELSPPFTAPVTSYVATVGNDINSITITPIPAHPAGSILVNGNSPAQTVPLIVGLNTIIITVIAEDGMTTGDHTLTVRRKTTDNKAPLLTLSSPAAGAIIVKKDGLLADLTLKGSVEDNIELDVLTVSINGCAPRALTLAGTSVKKKTFQETLPDALNVIGDNSLLFSITDTNGNVTTLSRTVKLIVRSGLTVNVQGSTNTSLISGKLQLYEVGKTYKFTARQYDTTVVGDTSTRFATWSGPGISSTSPVLSFTMTPALIMNPVITASYTTNPFTSRIAGRYDGLIRPLPGSPVDNHSHGHATLSLTSTGSYTGLILLDGFRLPFKGSFNGGGASSVSLNRNHLSLPPLNLEISVDLSDDTGMIQGTATAGSRVCEVICRRSHYTSSNPVPASYLNGHLGTKPSQRGYYTLVAPPQPQSAMTDDDHPQGSAFGVLSHTVSGLVSAFLRLQDHSVAVYSLQSVIDKNGTIPVFLPLYPTRVPDSKGLLTISYKGSFSGLLTLNESITDSDLSGTDLRWFRPAVAGAQYYPAGWPAGITRDVFGARYNAPAGIRLFDMLGLPDPVIGNAELHLEGGLLDAPFIRSLNLNVASGLATKVPFKPNDLSYMLSISKISGMMTGNFLHPDGKTSFNGIIYQKGHAAGGHGFFISPAPAVNDGLGQSGSATIKLK